MVVAASSDRPGRWDVPFDENMTDADVDTILGIAPFSDIDSEKFPSSIPLQGVIKNDTRILNLKKGDIVVREGDYGSSAFFILKGSVRVVIEAHSEDIKSLSPKEVKKKSWFVAFSQLWNNHSLPEVRKQVKSSLTESAIRSEGESARLFLQDVPRVLEQDKTAVIEQGEFFGEIAALARNPRTATIFADQDDVQLLEIKWQGLRELRQYTPQIRTHIDKLYRERSLKVHLRETSLFAQLNDQQLDEVARLVQFQSFGSFDWNTSYKKLKERSAENRLDHEPVIMEEGDYPNGLVLIRAGFARLSERTGSGHRTVSYLGKGQHYGFNEIAYNWAHKAEHNYRYTLRAIGHVDVLFVPTGVVEKYVLPSLPKQDLPAKQEGRQLDLASRDKQNRVGTDVLEFLVENRFINGTKSMLINLDRCTRCDDCVRACAAGHDNNPRFVREGKHIGSLMVGHACMHCRDPICMIGCPTGAIQRDVGRGQIVIQDIICIGCATCAESCPYENIQMVEARSEDGNFILDSATNKPIMKATKCDLCATQIGGPACQRACPHDALVRADMRDTEFLAKWLGR